MGFDSVTDAVRFLINNFLQGNINISLNGNLPSCSLTVQEEQEILESLKDKAKGRTKIFNPKSTSFHRSMIEFGKGD